MKILLTGGGTGGHFYPLIAVAEEINKIVDKEHILEAKIYYMAPEPYDKNALFEQGIIFEQISAGKLRRYFSIQNFFDLFKTFFGCLSAMFKIYSIFPDVIFAKGGYVSFPALLAARLFRIPVIIHESDSVPGKVNLWAAKFAKKIAVSYEEAGQYFPAKKTAWLGQPVRKELQKVSKEGAFEYLKLDPTIPVIFIVGGSQGSELINDIVIEALPNLISKYQIIHQVGKKNFDEIVIRTDVSLQDNEFKNRYNVFPFLNPLAIKMAAGASTLIVTRAGSMIFEIALWGVPAIVIPITDSNGDHQRKNAFNYARAGAGVVIEENNLTPTILETEIDVIVKDKNKLKTMREKALEFSRPDAAEKIAGELVAIAMSHEE